MDIKAHNGDPRQMVSSIRDILATASRRTTVPTSLAILASYDSFLEALPEIAQVAGLDAAAILFRIMSDLWSPGSKTTELPPEPPQSTKAHFFFLSGRWDRADPAAVLESLPVRPSRSTLDAALPAFAPVCSFFAIRLLPEHRSWSLPNGQRHGSVPFMFRRDMVSFWGAEPTVRGRPLAVAQAGSAPNAC
jgi:hypothetical protein